MSVRFNKVSFGYPDMPGYLLHDLSFHFTGGWTGILGANGAGKSTILRLAWGDLLPSKGSIQSSGLVEYIPQRTDFPPPGWDDFLAAPEATASRLRSILGIGEDWGSRWQALSHGERKRAQVAAALWHEPAVLLVDEPTNYLDEHAQSFVRPALAHFQGIGLLVSHDRKLLDDLCTQCLFLRPSGPILVPGGYSAASETIRSNDAQKLRERETARREVQRLARTAHQRQEKARHADKERSKRHLDRHDSDGRAKIDLARVTGKDGRAGRLASQLQGRLEKVQERFDQAKVEKSRELRFDLPGERSTRDFLLKVGAGSLSLGGNRVLEYPDLWIGPCDRIALSGPNGSGKSSLVRFLLERLNIAAERVVVIPQEIDPGEVARIISELRSLDRMKKGRTMAIIGCLGSEPERLLAGDDPSPGELRKILLALGMARDPYLLVLDEPTNHLDLPAIELLEMTLSGFPGGLLVVSHDRRFLDSLTTKRWEIDWNRSGMISKLVPG